LKKAPEVPGARRDVAPSDQGQALAPLALPRPAEVAAAGRLGDVLRAAEVGEADLPPLYRWQSFGRLRVVFLSAPVGLPGDDRVLLEQAGRLSLEGAEVTVLRRGRAPARPMPPGLRIVEVPFGGAFCDVLGPCDLVVAGCWDLVLPARRLGIAPVALLEQGDLGALGEVPEGLASLVARALRAAAAIWCIEPQASLEISSRYGVSAQGLPPSALREACEALVDLVPLAPSSDEGILAIDEVADAGHDLTHLKARLAICPTQELAVPVVQPAFGPYRIARWRVVGWRDGAPAGVTRLWAPLRSSELVQDAWHQGALELLRAHKPARAFRRYAAACEAGSAAKQAVAGRWAVVSLLEAGRTNAAMELAGAFARDFPTHPDYLALALGAARAAGRPIEVSSPLEAIRLLGEGSQHDEWFEDPYELAISMLRAKPERSS
jgi:hypothetical protein